jgi:NADH dehydrogenase
VLAEERALNATSQVLPHPTPAGETEPEAKPEPKPGPELGRILVTGANGSLGRRLLSRLASARPPRTLVRALVRSRAAADALAGSPHEVRIVDWSDPAELARAAAGCDAAVHLVGILKQTRRARYVDAHEGPARALAGAAATAGLRRIVALSLLGADPTSPNACLGSRGRSERLLLDGPVPVTLIRVGMVLGEDDAASRALRSQARSPFLLLVRGGAALYQPIDAEDVIDAVLAALARPAPGSETLELAGPESLPLRELVRRAARLHDRRPRIVPLPLALARAAARLVERLLADPPVTEAMLEVLERDEAIDPGPACRRLGLSLTPLDTALRRSVGPPAAAA